MLGAIVGDIVGSIYEGVGAGTKDFALFGPGCRFTDDTVCTIAVAECLLDGGDFADYLRRYVRRYPNAGYGGTFVHWGLSDDMPAYNSWGNGSAMRVSPCAYAGADLDEMLRLAERSAAVSHNHPEGIRGAQAIASAIRLAHEGIAADAIRHEIQRHFGYDLSPEVDDLPRVYDCGVSCMGSVPPAIVCAVAAADFEDAIRSAVSLGGDADTIGAMAGSIAEPLYGIPDRIAAEARARLDAPLLAVLDRFRAAYAL